AALAKVLCGLRPRLVLTEHGRHYPDRVTPLRRAENRLALDRLADAVTACWRFSADELSKVDGLAGRRIEAIGKGSAVERCGPAALRRLFREPQFAAKLGAAGRRRAEERYRLERAVERYDTLYRRLTGRRD